MEPSPRKYNDVIRCFLLFNKNAAGLILRRLIERPMEHISAHVYTKKDEVSQKKKKLRQTFTSTPTETKEKKKKLFNFQQINVAQSNPSLSPSSTEKSKHNILTQYLTNNLVQQQNARAQMMYL